MHKLWRGSRVSPAFVCFLALLAVEFLVFDQLGAKHHTRYYPRWNDQIQYLTESYTGYEFAREHGLAAGLKRALLNPSAQGTLHDVFAICVFAVSGPSRSAALSVNMLAFIVWQLSLYVFVRWRTGSTAAAWIAAGLLLTLYSPWLHGPGSAFDFRLDWLAVAAMGTALTFLAWSRGFERSRASIAFGVAASVVLACRFLTGPYLLFSYILILPWLLAQPDRWRRFGNLMLSGAVIVLLAGPILWINRAEVFNYYFIGHFTGPESAIRSPNFGLLRSVTWLFAELYDRHLGQIILLLGGSIALMCVLGAVLAPPPPQGKRFHIIGRTDPFWPLIACALAPAVLLILHTQKSPLVLGILVPGLLMTWTEVLARLQGSVSERWLRGLALAALLAGGITFSARIIPNPHSQDFISGARTVSWVADRIAERLGELGLKTPRVAVDRVTDCLDAQVLRVICYERQKRWIPFVMTLPYGIEETSDEMVMERLEQSDFVLLTEHAPEGAWPSDRQLARMREQTRIWAETHRAHIMDVSLFGMTFSVWERPSLSSQPQISALP